MSRLPLLALSTFLLAACAGGPPPKPREPVITAELKAAFSSEGLSVFADGCYQHKPVGRDTFLKQDSEAIAAAILEETVERLRAKGIAERTHTAPLYCGMLVNSIVRDAQHAATRDARAETASPPYYSHPQIAQYPVALDAYLRLLRSVYGVVIQDSGNDRLPMVVDFATGGLAKIVNSSADQKKRAAAETAALENGVTDASAAVLQKRLRARYVLMISDLERRTTRGARNSGVAVAVLTLGAGCLLSTVEKNVCDGDTDASYTAAALVDLKERRVIWQNGGKTLGETLSTLLD